MSAFSIRDGTPGDVAALARLDSSFSNEWVLFIERSGGAIEQTFALRWKRLKPEGSTRSFEEDEALLGEELAVAEAFRVAEAGGHAVAYLSLKTNWNRTAELTSIIVDAAHRGRGIGRAFVAEAESFARERGLRALQWEAQTDNRPAVEFAVAHGFRIAGLHDAFYRNDSIALQEEPGFRGIALFLTRPLD